MSEETPHAEPPTTPLTVELAPGLELAQNGYAEVELPSGVVARADLAYRDGRYRLWNITLTNYNGGEVQAEDLRKLTLGDLLEHANIPTAAGVIHFSDVDGEHRQFAWNLLTPEEAEAMRAAGPTHETLEAAARLYRVAYALRVSTRKTLMSVFKIAGPTADQWVSKARDRGLLEPVHKRGGDA